MTPVMCRTKHQPPDSYGDCLRACVASIMDMDGDAVPHFFEINDGEYAMNALREWLQPLGYAPFAMHLNDDTFEDLMFNMEASNPNSVYILIGSIGDGDHAAVYKGGQKLHNPAWYPMPFVGPAANGFWSILLIAKV